MAADKSQAPNDSAVRTLFRLADQIAERSPAGARFDGHGVPVRSTEASNGRMDTDRQSGWTMVALLTTGIVVGCAMGWELHEQIPERPSARGYRPASIEEAHRLLANASSGTLPQKLPKIPSPTIPPAYETTGTASKLQTSSGKHTQLPKSSLRGTLPSISPMAAPLPQNWVEQLPAASAGPLATRVPPTFNHSLEAKLKSAIFDVGGKVLSTNETEQGLILTVRVKSSMSSSMVSHVKHVGGAGVHVTEMPADESETEVDPVGAAELKAAEQSVASLRTQLAKDEVAFLPEAPALKSLRSQYLDTLQRLTELRRAASPFTRFRITVSGD